MFIGLWACWKNRLKFPFETSSTIRVSSAFYFGGKASANH
uniref:Uncharacterized protein n=1 Tax=Myoviridae sp. ctxpQ22 TaxID=2826715 RepID=A0A8S5N5C0_9CAUD|nr:MAG TPA: hypothetical protein [Myoviridae sp. ctxpQ22]